MESRKKELTQKELRSYLPEAELLDEEGTAYAEGEQAAKNAFGNVSEQLCKEKHASK